MVGHPAGLGRTEQRAAPRAGRSLRVYSHKTSRPGQARCSLIVVDVMAKFARRTRGQRLQWRNYIELV